MLLFSGERPVLGTARYGRDRRRGFRTTQLLITHVGLPGWLWRHVASYWDLFMYGLGNCKLIHELRSSNNVIITLTLLQQLRLVNTS